MHITSLDAASPYDQEHFVAEALLDGSHSNVRVIRLAAGQALPPHTHGESDLMLYAVEGVGTLDTADGPVDFQAGSLAHLHGSEELRIANRGLEGLTLLAFLSPQFPPRS
jgi:quercetin dioxygenase-like cupin family protein